MNNEKENVLNQITTENVHSKLEGLGEEEKRILFDALNTKIGENKNSKEIFGKSLEFEEDTFKIDSTGWIEATEGNIEEHPEIKKFINKRVKVKANATGDVVEYLDGPAKGEQIFITYNAFIRELMKDKNCTKEEAEQKYLLTDLELQYKMRGKPDRSEEYKEFFNQEINGRLAGYWDFSREEFYSVGDALKLWLADGDQAEFAKHLWGYYGGSRLFGRSGRLLKN